MRYVNLIKQKYNKNKSIINNSTWIITDKVYTMLVGVVITALIARYFGSEKYGIFNYSLSIVMLFTAVSTLGLPTLTVKSLIDKEFSENEIITTSIVLRLFGGIILSILALAAIFLLEPYNTDYAIIVLILSFSMTFKSFEVIDYWLQTYHLAKISSIIRICTYTIISVLKLSVIFFRGSLLNYSFLYSLDALLSAFALFLTFKFIFKKKIVLKLNIKYAKYILSNSWYLIISGLLVSVYMQIDKIMLGTMLPNKSEVGIYSVATQVAQLWFFIPMAIITSMQPVIMKARNDSTESYENKMMLLYRIIGFMGIAFGLFILVFSTLIIQLLYGNDYIRSASILTISVWAGTFAILGSARNLWLISENLQKYTIGFMGLGAITNILLNYILIPNYAGYGASIATLISQFIVVIVAPLFWKNTRHSTKLIFNSFFTIKRRES